MRKISVFLAAVLFALPCFASADAGMNKIREANSICPNVDSSNEKIARDAVKACDNQDVLEAILFYHEDFGCRFHAAKKIEDKDVLEKAQKIAETAHPGDDLQIKIRYRLLQLIDRRLSKASKKTEKASQKDLREKIWEIDNTSELFDIFHKDPDFRARYYAIKRIYHLITTIHMADSGGYHTIDIEAAEESLDDLKKEISKATPEIKAIEAKGKQKKYKEKLLKLLRQMEQQINPKPGGEVYIDLTDFGRHINAFRKKQGLEPIKRYDEHLNAAAFKWAKYHWKKRLKGLRHKNNGSTFDKRAEHEGYQIGYGAENLDRPVLPNAYQVFDDWRTSPGHRKNMLGEHYREMGLACVYAPVSKEYTDYVCVQLLADENHVVTNFSY